MLQSVLVVATGRDRVRRRLLQFLVTFGAPILLVGFRQGLLGVSEQLAVH